MDVSPVSFTSGLAGVRPLQQPAQQTGATGFSDVVSGMLSDVNQQHVQADASIEQLITGETENVDDVVMSVVQADLAFRMVLEIRNRLISSYQEVMRMQV